MIVERQRKERKRGKHSDQSLLASSWETPKSFPTHNITMVQFFSDFDNPFQEDYNKFIESLNFSSLECSACKFLGDCSKHAYYTRKIVIVEGKVAIKILRIQCGQCDVTHALLPSQIVPYSQILLEDQVEIITQYEAGATPHSIVPSNPEIDTWIVIHIIKQYLNHWMARLLSDSISLDLVIRELILLCFKHHNRQFMQIKCGINSLFQSPT